MASPPSRDELRQREPMWRVIAQHIRNDIEAGRLRHGQPLPSTRALAAEWGVSVDPVARAMSELTAEGLVVARDRSSRVVNNPEGQALAPLLPVTPKVLLIGGYAGSGKTELGRIIARQTRWPILDKDTTTRPVVEAALEALGIPASDRESDTYLTVIRPAEYDALLAAMTENLACGNSAIVTAPFVRELSDKAWCDRVAANIASLGGELHTVWVRCDADTMRMYLRHRGAARDSAKLADWDGYLAGIDLAFTPATNYQVIENSAGARPLQEQADELLKLIV